MGAYCHIPLRAARSSLRRFGAALGALALLLGPIGAPAETAAEDGERSVSTSPTARAADRPSADRQQSADADETPVLTRAAAQQRVDDMTPMTWLARFGRVSVGRLD